MPKLLDKDASYTFRTIYGAVTMENLWIFRVLDQQRKLITQDIGGYQVPDDVEDLVRVLVGILVG